MIISKIA